MLALKLSGIQQIIDEITKIYSFVTKGGIMTNSLSISARKYYYETIIFRPTVRCLKSRITCMIGGCNAIRSSVIFQPIRCEICE